MITKGVCFDRAIQNTEKMCKDYSVCGWLRPLLRAVWLQERLALVAVEGRGVVAREGIEGPFLEGLLFLLNNVRENLSLK